MNVQYNPYWVPLLTGAMISLAIALFTWKRRYAPGKTPFALLMLAVAEWSLSYAFELGSVNPQVKILWAVLKYHGVVAVPLAWLIFTLKYTGHGPWITLRKIILLSLVPVITITIVWTNDLHYLFWSSLQLELSGSFSILVESFGPWFWVHALYSYLLLLYGTILLVRVLLRSPHLFRGQTIGLLIGVLTPWAGNAIYLSGLSPFYNIDSTSLCFTLTGLIFSWSLFRFRFLDIIPMARDVVIENLNDAVIVIDLQTRIVDVNPAAQKLIGYSASGIFGQPSEKVLSGWPELAERSTRGADEGSEVMREEGESKRYFELKISPLYDSRRRHLGKLLLLHDITRRKQSQKELELSHHQLELRVLERTRELTRTNEILKLEITDRERAEKAINETLILVGRAKREWESTADSLSELVFLIDSQGNILRTNRTIERWGIGKVSNVKGSTVHDIVHPACAAPACYLVAFWKEAWKELTESRPSYLEVEDHVLKRHLRIQIKPITLQTYQKGEETQSFGVAVISDITEQKQAQHALRESEAYSKTLLDSIRMGVMLIDRETQQIVDANSFALEMIGKSREQLIGQECHQHVCPTESGNCPVIDHQQTVETSERVLLKNNGEQIPILKSVVPITRMGHPYLVESFVDISTHKQTEREMTALQEQLRQSQKMEAVGRLAGGIAHDFNNLLTPIVGYSQLAIGTLSPNDPMHADLQEIQKSAERASKLIRQLMSFSRRQTLKPQVINISDILVGLGKMIRPLIDENVEVIILPAEELGSIMGDPSQLEQVLINLIVNAKDAMPNGGKLILETSNAALGDDYLHKHSGMDPGKYVMLAVSDTGTGMTEKVKAQLFEPFFTTKEPGKGTGLGLSTVYGIVKQNNGHILVYSEPGQGTTFKIYFPLLEEKATSLPRRDDIGYMPRGDETILLVEDEPLVRGFAARVLREQGYSVLEGGNGQEALKIATEYSGGQIDLLFTDVVMPHLGGKELADRLKTLRPEIRILFTSGYTDNAVLHQGLLDREIDFLEKPFSPFDLARKVREVLDR